MPTATSDLRQLTMELHQKLPVLLLPTSSRKEEEKHRTEINEFAERLKRISRELKNNKHPDEVRRRKEQAEALVRVLQEEFRKRGLNAMRMANEIHEVIENSEFHLEEVSKAMAEGRRMQTTIGPPTPSNVIPIAPLHILDTAVPLVTFAALVLKWLEKRKP